MPREKTLTEYIFEKLREGGWLKIDVDEENKTITCPKGELLSFSSGYYHLNFFAYSSNTKEFYEREKYKKIIFSEDFDIKKYLYFKRNGNFSITRESQFKKVINPTNREVESIKLIEGVEVRRFYGNTLTISKDVFINSLKDSERIYKKKNSYATSIENYLSRLASVNYGKDAKEKKTSIEKGEFSFLIDRFNLQTKRNKKDFEKYLDKEDISQVAIFTEELIKKEVFSDDFLRKLNDYFIKEKLEDIINLGKEILNLKSTDLTTTSAQKVIGILGLDNISQLENLWQKYFEKYLLYLIFSYKKIFPKIELKNIDGDKKYPDFIGINHYNGLDIIEIKTHLKNALVWDRSHQNFYFSPETSKAIVQTMNYLDAINQERFKNERDKNGITSFTDKENLYHPRGIIIISSKEKLTTKKGEDEKLNRDFTKLRNSLHNIEILTFDEIINIADEYIKNIIN